ncbi:cellulase family glycosylhydrolase [Neptunicella marina]|uniref:Cellulase family glycosylhydrolase n=1 Tax=Neptunicella marina TaxID=2125989 RepID=A0A8J6M088_9ALTE|nr:cellulase family glycosylhydrolase [Neptunicella marina]MBC3766985.1 cellulase family glycosylhydrolase [Neptunicella marina]
MNKIRLTSIAIFFTALSVSSYAKAEQGFVHAEGQQIVDGNNQPLILRGMGLGGWMLQEGYMLELGPIGTQTKIKQAFSELIGPEKTQNFYDAWLKNFITKRDIDAMANWGYNSVRLPMHFNLFTLPVEQEPVKGEQTWLAKGFDMVDELLAWSKANNIYLILDLHAAPGGQGNDINISDRDISLPSLWQSDENRNKTIALWKELARRYKHEPMIAAYDIINEPNWGFESVDDKHGCNETSNKPLDSLLKDITRAIRSEDTQHMIIIEGNCWGNNYQGISPDWDDNMAISFHKYWNDTTTDSIQTHLAMREKYNKPVWLGESGENSNQWFSDAIGLAESHGIGWAFWPLKKIRLNNPLQVPANEGYLDVVNYLLNNGEKPSSEHAYKALMQLTQDVKYENNIKHPDVADAMLIQPHNKKARAYKDNVITNKTSIAAVNYDLGGQGVGYYDELASNVSTRPGGKRWNQGMTYRNDGVDITYLASEPVVNDFTHQEWMQYTVNAQQAGRYSLSIKYRAEDPKGQISVLINNQQTASTKVTDSKGLEFATLNNISLYEGTNTIRLLNSGKTPLTIVNLTFTRL